ncbi:MAG: hypothetical protein K0Q73_1984 [Paenibacillus sp.]|nr:hypothetical protein [Paenibacillus sp.]
MTNRWIVTPINPQGRVYRLLFSRGSPNTELAKRKHATGNLMAISVYEKKR